MYRVSTQGVDEHMINVHYYYYFVTRMHACRRARTHTHTHTLQIYVLFVTGWQNGKKENNRSVSRREEIGFQF